MGGIFRGWMCWIAVGLLDGYCRLLDGRPTGYQYCWYCSFNSFSLFQLQYYCAFHLPCIHFMHLLSINHTNIDHHAKKINNANIIFIGDPPALFFFIRIISCIRMYEFVFQSNEPKTIISISFSETSYHDDDNDNQQG